MSSYQVIAETGKTIIKLLRENLAPEPIPKPEMIELCAPYEENDFRLTVYLYSIQSNGLFPDSTRQSLDLYYLFTAFSKAELKTKAYDESYIMGKTMQIMNQNAILRGSLLEGSLAENNEELKIILHNLSTDDISKIWNFSNIQYKLSVAYMVSPVYIDSTIAANSKRVMK
ncbi:DUF4255 domain-containing protein [Pseudobacteroides cellulosolvens]|uniref:Pvc16 N-terminal domain-containing protein n=1 Tax=Pseudobacteroides cellulosolvens ATCC 35603 = DSM 2933 TaxID=398512 RepID=A0A0L6JHY5_9FIRM|nr:DUF4255 domain-containing protein [Pseudobacteroides cellulosolvens]KNY25315.1 Protein of unknown function DUF4255 [Pseudobacteroides cellulosolvens ATCC 35603 = DSM 2933]